MPSEVSVYLMTGFLDSGKTTFLNFTLNQEYFQIGGLTLLILCEEGEAAFDETALKRRGVVVERVENQEDFTEERLQQMQDKYKPERVVIEYNGMWPVSRFEKVTLPVGWVLEQKLTTVNAETFQMYLLNLKSLFVEMVRGSEMVLFNRCRDRKPLAGYRRSVKVVSPQAEVIFEDENGEIENIFAEEMPYDLSADIVEIRPEDYGIWYVDLMERPEKYKGKIVEITAQIKKPKFFPDKYFLPGRMAMTCCADDLTFLGYVCRSEEAQQWQEDTWVTIQAKITFARLPVYEGIGPVLNAISIRYAEPIEGFVDFN